MEITDIRIRKLTRVGKMLAIVSVAFDNVFVVHDIKIINGENGLFVVMPSKQNPSGEFRDICHPIDTDFRAKISDAIIDKYNLTVYSEEVAATLDS